MLFAERRLGVCFFGAALLLLVAASRDQDSSRSSSSSSNNVLLSTEVRPRRKKSTRGSVRGATSPPLPPHHHIEAYPARPSAPSREIGAPSASPSRHLPDASNEGNNKYADIADDVDVEFEPSDAMRQLGSSDEELTLSAGIPMISVAKPEDVNRCSTFDLSSFNTGKECGAPLSSPCFDLSRCVNGPSIYVYDYEVRTRFYYLLL